MYLFVETICIKDGIPQHLAYHQYRMEHTRQCFFQGIGFLDLAAYISASIPVSCPGRWKCRVVYGETFQEATYSPYLLRPVCSLRLVTDNRIDYGYKSSDRRGLKQAFSQRGTADDVLIVKHGLLTDTSIGNVALWDGAHWYTPDRPLLAGTKRQWLIDNGVIREKSIRAADLLQFSHIAVFNALIDWKEVVVEVKNIFE